MTATADKTSLKSIFLVFGPYSLSYATGGLVGAPWHQIEMMRDLLLCVHVVVKTINLEISRFRLADYVKELYESACGTCSTIVFSHSTNQIIVFWPPSSLLKLSITKRL